MCLHCVPTFAPILHMRSYSHKQKILAKKANKFEAFEIIAEEIDIDSDIEVE